MEKNLHVTDQKFITPVVVIGGNMTGPAYGWESIKPKKSSKPAFLIDAQIEMESAWENYMWAIDSEWDQGTIEDVYEIYYQAEKTYREAYEAYENDLIESELEF